MTRHWYGYKHELRNGRWVVCEPTPLAWREQVALTVGRGGGMMSLLADKRPVEAKR